MRSVLVMGGFTESRRVLEPVANEAVRQGFGDDADVLTLRDARNMDYERLRQLMAGKNAILHSAAVVPVPDARQRTHDSELPKNLIVVAAPEPRGMAKLASTAVAKTARHMFGAADSPRDAHFRVAAGNMAEVLAHPLANLGSLAPDIARFSAMDRVTDGAIDAEDRVGYFPMAKDEFYAESWVERFDDSRRLIRAGGVARLLDGGHDDLLTDPAGVLHDIDHAFALGHIGQPMVGPLS